MGKEMFKFGFKFGAYGILAIAALAMFLYVSTSLAGRPDIGKSLLDIAIAIVAAFIIYMFLKIILKRYRI